MKVVRLTPVLVVDRIEPCLAFWVDRLGFSTTAAAPNADRLGCIILERNGIQVMYQTVASVADDVGPLAGFPIGGAALFIVVDDLDTIERAMKGVPPLIPRRTTFYGADELIFREPGGNVITFAQFAAAETPV